MEDFNFFVLIVSFLAFFGCLLAIRLKFLFPGAGEYINFNFSVSITNCTLSTCSLMQQPQNFIISAANHAAGLRSSNNPSTVTSLPATTALGNKMLPTRHWFFNLKPAKEIPSVLCFAQKYVLPQLSINA